MGVNESGKDGPPLLVHDVRSLGPSFAWMDETDDLAVVADEHGVEMFDMSRRVDLDAVDVIEQRVGGCRGGEERCNQCNESGSFHVPWLSIVTRAVKG
jgi:hypothetical protein